jgi:Zn-dependent protease with chaperone function
MLTLLVGLVLVRVFVAGEVRRARHSGLPLPDQLARIRATSSIPASLGLGLGVICAGEVLLEVPALREAWALSAALAAFLFRLCATAVWLDAMVVAIHRLSGAETPYGPAMARALRVVVVQLLPRYLVPGVLVQVLDQGVSGFQLTLLYLGFVLVHVVGAPLLHRLGEATREPTPEEAAVIRRLSANYGLHMDRIRVERDGRNARVAGAGPSARIFVGELVLAGPEDQLAAVLAHEAAHRDRHHIAWRIGWTVLSTVLMVVCALTLLPAAVDHGDGALLLSLAVVVLLPLLRHLVLGLLQVSQELDADAYAASRVGAEPLARYLVQFDDGIPLGGRGGLRYRLRTAHPTLAERLDNLKLAAAR